MAVLPRELLLQRMLVQDLLKELQFQPAGVDLTVEKVFTFSSPGTLDFSNEKRELSLTKEIPFDGGRCFLPKGAYKVRFAEAVALPLDTVGLIFPRSSLLRCGASLEGAIWDPGYRGKGESLLVVYNPHGLTLYHRARIAQMIFIKLVRPVAEGYQGKYQGEHLG